MSGFHSAAANKGQALLALGHSARDTVEMLHHAGVAMTAKPFAVGVRIEHRQEDMDAAQYKQYAGHPCLPPSTYKLSCHLDNGRSAFSFCVCPGGQVVAAASEEQRVVDSFQGRERYEAVMRDAQYFLAESDAGMNQFLIAGE